MLPMTTKCILLKSYGVKNLRGVGASCGLCPWPAVLSMSFNNTSQQEEAPLPLPSFPPPVVAPPAVEQPAQLEGVPLEEPPAAAAAPQADSLSSPSPAPELIQPPPPPPPLEPHLSGPPGPEPKVPAVSSATWTGPGPQPAVLSALHMLSTCSLHDLPTPCDSLGPLCASGSQRMCDNPVHVHHSGPGEQKDWCI